MEIHFQLGPSFSLIFNKQDLYRGINLCPLLLNAFPTFNNCTSVRSLSVSFFIEKEPHSSQEWNERERVEIGERDTPVVRMNEATAV
jgi:hypothetical protein